MLKLCKWRSEFRTIRYSFDYGNRNFIAHATATALIILIPNFYSICWSFANEDWNSVPYVTALIIWKSEFYSIFYSNSFDHFNPKFVAYASALIILFGIYLHVLELWPRREIFDFLLSCKVSDLIFLISVIFRSIVIIFWRKSRYTLKTSFQASYVTSDLYAQLWPYQLLFPSRQLPLLAGPKAR
jgi:hypothetical protein